MAKRIQLRRDTAANWASTNPTLAQGEKGIETDTGRSKIGDGATAWNALRYYLDPATNRQVDDYTLVLTDGGKLVEMNKATANTLTIPPNANAAFPISTQILVAQYGAGQTSIAAGAGVTIRSAGGNLKISAQYAAATLVKIAADEWYLFGSLTA